MVVGGLERLKNSCALVTGGAGFIGSHLVDALIGVGARVRVLDNLATGSRSTLTTSLDGIEFFEGDIRDEEACGAASQGVDYVFHQAALSSVPRSLVDPASTIAVNVAGTAQVFAAARKAGVKRVVYASSSSVYGDSAVQPRREGTEGNRISPYALSKWMNEELAATFSRCFKMQFIGLRYFNIYGPRQRPDGPYAAVIPRFFSACREGRAPTIFGDGTQTRDFTYVADAVRANLRAALAPDDACGRAYNIGASRSVTVSRLALLIAERMELGVQPVHQAARSGDVMHAQADTTLARTHLGFEAEVPLEAGLGLTAQSYGR